MNKHLLELWEKVSTGLAQSLEARMKDRTSGLQKKLSERAAKEAADIRAIMTELKKSIDALDDLSIGGFRVHFTEERVGSKLVELSLIDSQGRVRE